MSLQFVFGGSGSGKTRGIYNQLIELSLKNPQQSYLVIVPEQFTMQTQKELVELHPRHGLLNIDIVSFQRLAYRIFEELGIENPMVLDDMGKSMVLRKVAADHKHELIMYRRHLDKNGFIGHLKSMISELYQYGISSERINHVINHTDSMMLKRKMEDISIIYQGFQRYIQDKFITTEEILDVLCRVISGSGIIKDSVIVLDGYTGFTPVQYRLLDLMMQVCKKLVVTVTIDPYAPPYQTSHPQALFYMSRQIVETLNELAMKHGVEREEDQIFSCHPAPRYSQEGNGKVLDFLEQNLFRYGRNIMEEQQDTIRVFQSLNPSKEVEELVAQIHELVKNKAYRYKDIAVIASDLETYSKEICRQFESVHIPYFLDDKKSIMENPMAEFIRAALEVVQRDFSYESIFRYLKTGLVTEKTEICDRLENYVRAIGIRGYQTWNKNWEWIYGRGKNINLEEVNQLREEILEPFHQLRSVFLNKETTVTEMTQALVEFLNHCEISKKIDEYQKRFLEQEEYSLSKEYQQVYQMVMELFDRVVSLLGEERLSRKEYIEILDAGFSEIKVGIIPATVDRLVVGNITRTRLGHIKVLFFVGMNDGLVPERKERGSLLTDRERMELKEKQMELAPTATEEGIRQKFYLYLILTKPQHQLILSYSAVSGEGKPLRPSTLIKEVGKLFPSLKINMQSTSLFDRAPTSIQEAKQWLISGLESYEKVGQNNRFLELYRWFFQSDEYRREVLKLTEAAFYLYDEKGIGKTVSQALYGRVLSGSVTRLEKYASCAYAHFLTYGLELSERTEYELKAVDVGNLFHRSLDLFFKKLQEEEKQVGSISPEERGILVTQCVALAARDYGNSILTSTARNTYLVKKVERMTERTVWALGEQLKKGEFIPAEFELSFSAADNLSAMKISLDQNTQLHLRGTIDRLDLYQDQDRVYVKIIDYKSGKTMFDLESLYDGLQLQLVVYMDAVMELQEHRFPDKQVIPAGLFYYNINDPFVEKTGQGTVDEVNRMILKQLKMNGLVNSDLEVIRLLDREIETESDVIPVAVKNGLIQESRSSIAGEKRIGDLRRFIREKLKTEGQEILSGHIEVRPYKKGTQIACKYCPYHSVCGFDLKIKGYQYQRLKQLKSEDIWKEIEGEEIDGNELDKRSNEGDR